MEKTEQEAKVEEQPKVEEITEPEADTKNDEAEEDSKEGVKGDQNKITPEMMEK